MSEVITADNDLTEEELVHRRAWELGTSFAVGVKAINQAWVKLAEVAYEIKEMQAWKRLGHDTYGEWLAQPENGNVTRRDFDRLVELHREYVVNMGVDPERLGQVDRSKAGLILKSIKDGDLDLEDGLSKAESLGYRDLQIEVGQKEEPAAGTVPCPGCGQLVSPKRLEERRGGPPPVERVQVVARRLVNDEDMTLVAAAEVMGVSKSTVHKWVHDA